MPRQRRQRNNSLRSQNNALEIQVTDNETVITATSTASLTSFCTTISRQNHHPQLYLPRPDFLNVLKDVGAKGHSSQEGELFTVKELGFFLKEYIKSHQLYDEVEPSIVYCDKDPLGKVFNVTSFTVNDARNLLLQNASPVEDRRFLQQHYSNHSKKFETESSPKNATIQRPPLEIQVDQVVSSTQNETPSTCPSLNKQDTIILEKDNEKNKIILEKDTSKDEFSQGYDTDDGGKISESFTVINNTPTTNDSGVGESYLDSFSTPSKELNKETPKGNAENKNSILQSSHDSLYTSQKGKGVKRKRHRTDSGLYDTKVSSAITKEEADHLSGRKRGSSFSLVLEDTGKGEDFKWDILIPIIPSSDDSEILSVQSKETATVKSSSDSDWSSNDELNAISIQISPSQANFDPPFQEEYDVDSESVEGLSNRGSGRESDSTDIVEEILVVCPESDVDFWADSESSDSESDLNTFFDIPDEDKWECQKCNTLNTPLRRRCDRCMEIRPYWLPPRRSRENDQTSSGEDETDVPSSSQKSSSQGTEVGLTRQSISDMTAVKNSSDVDKNHVCKICFSNPKDASIVHGKSGHQVCCYKCAKKLRRKGKPCPVCRRPIQRIIKNFIL